jgi:hypothetical protein
LADIFVKKHTCIVKVALLALLVLTAFGDVTQIRIGFISVVTKSSKSTLGKIVANEHENDFILIEQNLGLVSWPLTPGLFAEFWPTLADILPSPARSSAPSGGS